MISPELTFRVFFTVKVRPLRYGIGPPIYFDENLVQDVTVKSTACRWLRSADRSGRHILGEQDRRKKSRGLSPKYSRNLNTFNAVFHNIFLPS